MIQTLMLTAYTLVALIFLDNTYREGELSGKGWDAMRVLGLLLCIGWPALILHVTILAYRSRHAR